MFQIELSRLLQNPQPQKVQVLYAVKKPRSIEEYRRESRSRLGDNDPAKYKFNRFTKASLSELLNYSEEELEGLKQWVEKPARFFMVQGLPGVGKTHASAAVYNKLWKDGKDVRYINYADMIETLRSCFEEHKSEHAIFAKLCEVDHLILDDLGTVKPTDWVHQQVYRLINTRYELCLPTFITTNLLTEDEFKVAVGERTTDRLLAAENTRIVKEGNEAINLRKEGY